jgi:hypothetical protein
MEVKVQYQINISNWFPALENWDDDDDVWTSVGLGKVLERI